MAENKFSFSPSCSSQRDTVCIDTNRVLDSCRDRDCYENVRVYLSDFGNEILERTGAIRAKSAEIIWTYVGIDPIQFNRGFYAVTIRFYVKVVCEACIGGGHSQELEGITVLEKRVILYGGESNVSIYRSSSSEESSFCSCPQPCAGEKNVPTAVVEVVTPVLLGTKIMERSRECKCCCCCRGEDVPEQVTSSFDAPLIFDDGIPMERSDGRHYLTVSLGIFSVVRIVRPGQYLVQATEYSIPEKECSPAEEDNPCSVFRDMPFPVGEFGAQNVPPIQERSSRCGCGS